MKNLIAIARFSLILPVAAMSWFAVFLAGILTEVSVRRHLCPNAYQRGNPPECTTPYTDEISTVIFYLFIALSAVTVVGAAVLLAPAQKYRCGIAIYCVGAVVATALAIEFGLLALLVALCAGLLPLIALKRLEHQRNGFST